MGRSSDQGAQAKRELSALVRIFATASEFLYCGDGNERSIITAVARERSRRHHWLTDHKFAQMHLVFEPGFLHELRCPYGRTDPHSAPPRGGNKPIRFAQRRPRPSV